MALITFLAMVFVQICYAGMNIVTKLALDSGMSPFILITYRQILAAIALAPFAFFIERRTLPTMTGHIIFLIFLCSILGATLNQCFYVIGLKHSTPTIATALGNLLPATTFVMAVPFRMETVLVKKRVAQAKVLGKLICVSGAMVMSLYHGKLIHMVQSGIHWNYAIEANANNSRGHQVSFVGPLFIIASCVACSGWFVLQAKLKKMFVAPYTTNGLMSFMAILQAAVIAVIFKHDAKDWSLSSNVRLIGVLYNGLMVSAVACIITSWVIKIRGPFYVTAFSPLLLVMVAVFGWAFLDEKVYVGSAVGAVLIVAGLYTILWGKEKEIEDKDKKDKAVADVEKPFVHLNGDLV